MVKFVFMNTTTTNSKSIFLADDDADDCMLFHEALNELNSDTQLTITNDGSELMSKLDDTVPPPPYVIFLDLNMPGKNGFECLHEIRETVKFKDIPVVIFSTSSNPDIIERTYRAGANYYVCKPGGFKLLIKTIEKVLTLDPFHLSLRPARNEFVIKVS